MSHGFMVLAPLRRFLNKGVLLSAKTDAAREVRHGSKIHVSKDTEHTQREQCSARHTKYVGTVKINVHRPPSGAVEVYFRFIVLCSQASPP